VLAPEELGMARVDIAALAGGATAAENAGLIEAILQGIDRGPRRDIVLLNAGAALEVAGVAQDLPEGIARASEAVDGGAALDVLTKLRGFRA
jgi:anthranilate phosphoribosyltransferase